MLLELGDIGFYMIVHSIVVKHQVRDLEEASWEIRFLMSFFAVFGLKMRVKCNKIKISFQEGDAK